MGPMGRCSANQCAEKVDTSIEGVSSWIIRTTTHDRGLKGGFQEYLIPYLRGAEFDDLGRSMDIRWLKASGRYPQGLQLRRSTEVC